MRNFGLIWNKGRGKRSPKMQREILANVGVPKGAMIDRLAIDQLKPGDVQIVVYLLALGNDDEGAARQNSILVLADEYAAISAKGAILTVIETNRSYEGVEGFRDLIRDWLKDVRTRQTEKARGAARRRPKQPYPKFWTELTATEQTALRRDFEHDKTRSVAIIAKTHGVSRRALYRLAKAKGWKRTERTMVDDNS